MSRRYRSTRGRTRRDRRVVLSLQFRSETHPPRPCTGKQLARKPIELLVVGRPVDRKLFLDAEDLIAGADLNTYLRASEA